MKGRLLSWTGLIAVTGFAQIVIQGIGFAGGIFLIRMLPTHEYAVYTLANTMLGTMTSLSDAGVANAVMAVGGKVWKDKFQLGSVVATGMRIRQRFAKVSLAIAIPATYYLLNKSNIDWQTSTLLVLALIPAYISALTTSLLVIPPKLAQEIAPLQKTQVKANVIRFILLVVSVLALPYAAMAIVGSGIAQAWMNWRLRSLTKRYADTSAEPDQAVQRSIMSSVRRTIPGVLYYVISGQLPIWILSMMGKIESVAQVGALSRLGMVLNLFGVLITTLVIPRYARLRSAGNILVRRFIQVQFILIAVSAAIVSLTWFFPGKILWILGSGYDQLNGEVVLMAAGGCMAFMAGTTYQKNAVRNFIFPPLILYPILITAQLAFLFNYGISDVFMALAFALFLQSLAYALHFGYGLAKVMKSVQI